MTSDKGVSQGAGLCTPESPSLASEGQAVITCQVRWFLFGQRQFSAEEGGCELWLPGWVPERCGWEAGRDSHNITVGQRQGTVSKKHQDLFQDGRQFPCICPSSFCLAKRPQRQNRGAPQKLHAGPVSPRALGKGSKQREARLFTTTE